MPKQYKTDLQPLDYEHARLIVVRGKRAKPGQKNPYQLWTTKWYCWKTGRENKAKHITAPVLLAALRNLGYPIKYPKGERS